DFVVGGHHTDGSGFLQNFFKRSEEDLAQHPFRNIGGSAIHAGLGLSVTGEMFQGCDYMFAIVKGRIPLEATHGGNSHARDKIWVFPIGLFAAAPTGIADDVNNRSEHMVCATHPSFFGGHREQALDQCGVEGSCQSDWLRKAGSIDCPMSMQTLFME